MGSPATATAAAEKVTWDSHPYYLTSFGVHKSRRYHAKMSGMYQRLNDFVLVFNAIAGAGAFIVLIGGKDGLPAQILIGSVAIASAINSALGFSKKSKKHFDLCSQFTDLAKSIEQWEPTEKNLQKAKAQRLQIEKGESDIKRLIDIIARNEELLSRGYPPEDRAPVSWLQSKLGYFFTFGMTRLNNWRDQRETQLRASQRE